MATKKKVKNITGPDGQVYPVEIIDKQIVRRDTLVREVVEEAERLAAFTRRTHERIMAKVQTYLYDAAAEYGEDWQGNAILSTFDATQQVEVDVMQTKTYDERLAIAGEKIRSWLDEKLDKVTDPTQRKILEQISSIARTLMRIDHKGKVDQKKILLLKKFDFANEPQWKEAMKLLTDAEQITGSKRYIRFKKANESGKLEAIKVDFSSI